MKALKEALKDAPPALLLRDLAKKIAKKTGSAEDDTYETIELLAKLYRLRQREGSKPLEFATEVCKAAEAAGLQPAADGWQRVKSDLEALLSFDVSLGITSKALDVMTEHERILCKARILTDLRPVFKENVGEGPAAAVIIHTLRIRFHSAGEMREFFVAMDSQDLKELGKLIERAVQKDSSLRDVAKKADLQCLDPETD